MSISVKIFGGVPLPTTQEIEEIDFCFCGVDCYDNYIEKAFVASASSESWKRDKASFLFRKVIDIDTVSIEIWKGGSKVADVIDNTYGEYYPTFEAKPEYVGFIVDWSLVSGTFGNGIYTIRATRTTFGQPNNFTSRKYQVLPYSDKLADKTVRIETYTNGNILDNEFDYQNLLEGGWYQSIRIEGRFGNVTPTLIEDRILDSGRKVVSVQDSIENEYSLFTRYLPESVNKQIINQQSLVTSAFITDNNLLNDEVIRQRPVIISSFEETRHQQRGTAHTIKFKDRFNNKILRIY